MTVSHARSMLCVCIGDSGRNENAHIRARLRPAVPLCVNDFESFIFAARS